MPKLTFLISIFLISSLIATCQENSIIKQLQQLNGLWKTGTAEKTIYESWQTISDMEMDGKSYKIKATDTIIFEQTKIVEKNNEVNYIAKVSNQNGGKEVPFKLISSANQTFIFENPEHDFPQRVIYQLVSKDSLHAWIEGKYKGKDGREDYYYARVSWQ